MAAPTLTGRIVESANHRTGVTFVSGDTEVRLTWFELYERARASAAALQARGIGPGSHVGLLGPTTCDLATTIEAVWLAGATLVVLPLPMRMSSLDDFIDQTRRRITHADIELLVIDPDFAPFVPPEGMPPTVTYAELSASASAFQPIDPAIDSLAVLQFTSGSTADPKGVMLPHRTVCANLDAITAAADLLPGRDVMVSWLPLYHDMGLVGFLMLPMSAGVELVLGAPQDFMADPGRWMRWISKHGGTATAGPNFSWVLATKALLRDEKRGQRLDLSQLRVALNGAEPVDCAAVDRFVEVATNHGLDPGAIFPAFGMAELVIGGTFPKPWSGLRRDAVDRDVLERQRRAVPVAGDDVHARHLAYLGSPLPGLELRIVDPASGAVLPDRHVGELQIRGSSVTPGYYKRPDANDALFAGEWLRTGDLAYLVDGEMVMCGRIKDVIIIGGRNIFPDDIERGVGELDGVRAGNVIAFGLDSDRGKESLIVVAEVSVAGGDDLRHTITKRVLDLVGIPPRDVMLVKAGELPKTSSGKLQRSACRARYLAAEFSLVP